MNGPDLNELTSRAREIFRRVVEGYLENGLPVASKTLASESTLNLSSASIRAVLAELEARGLLAAPHTSAGRMPTDSGLRLFVDGMMQVAEPSAEERRIIEQQFAERGPIERSLEKASAFLSDISHAAGLVMQPTREVKLTQVNLIDLGSGRILAVLVGEDGGVENRVLEIGHYVSPSALEQASNFISAHMRGRSLREASEFMHTELELCRNELDSASHDLIARGIAMWSEDAARRPVLIVRGQANLLDENASQSIGRVRALLDDLENKQSISNLLETARDATSARIFIGSENPLFDLSGSSVIAAPYHDRDGKVIGVLGVIGPARLNYARIVPMVDFTARSLGKIIG